MEIRDEVPSSEGTEDMDTSGYQESDLQDIEFHWEDPDMNMDAIFRPGIDISFSLSTSNASEVGSMAENPILTDEEQKKNNTLAPPTTLVSERPTHPCVDEKSPLWNKIWYCSRLRLKEFVRIIFFINTVHII